MTNFRRLPKGKSVFLYYVTNHGVKKVKQNSQYIDKDIIEDGKTVI
jgi:hypothetical protein